MVARIRSIDLAAGKRREGQLRASVRFGARPTPPPPHLNRWRFRIFDLDPASMSAPVPLCGLKHERSRPTL